MTSQTFSDWLDKLKIAWETKNPQMAADLCAENVLYYETPFDKPLKTKDEVLYDWKSVPEDQKDIIFDYKILSVNENLGIAHWTAKFTRIPSGNKANLDGIFKVVLNEEGLCTEFRQWWNSA